MDSCPDSEHHVYRCLTETGRECFPSFSLFSQKGGSFPEAPADTPSVPIGRKLIPETSCKGGWERLAGVADSLGGAPSHQEVGGCAYLWTDLSQHLLTGSSPASPSQHQPCKMLAQEACPPLRCWSVLIYDLPLCRMRRWELLWTGKLGFNAQFRALVCILICMMVWLLWFSCYVCVWLFCDPVDCSPPGSSIHGVSQARILEWVAIPFSRGSSWPRDWIHVSCTWRWILHYWATGEISQV